ncbi:MAG TPA: SMP-30/gluconolactonase/LRE family protein [Casimicrobiaceae bacterium]|nr:SMP-30/gluconolactonase/LRE family protein [Casimicrobiaceae bacterium]
MTAVELVADARAQAGESPWWCTRSQTLWWVDIHGCTLHRYDPATHSDALWQAPDLVTFVATHRAQGVVIALRDRIVHADTALTSLVTIAAPGLRPGQRLNDGTVDPTGRLWIGAMDCSGEPEATLYRIDHDGRCEAKVTDLRTTNGLAFSPDGATLYVSDSHPAVRTVWAFDVDLSRGLLTHRRVFVDTRELPGRPDGACVDVNGCYWMAAVDGGCLLRFDADGHLVDRVTLPVEKPSKAAFGGPDLRDLYITSLRRNLAVPVDRQPQAGGLFRVQSAVPGSPLPDCAIDVDLASSRVS